MMDAELDNRFGPQTAGPSAEWRLLLVHSITTEAARKIASLCPASRELSLSLTALQEAKLWARESILCHQELLEGAKA